MFSYCHEQYNRQVDEDQDLKRIFTPSPSNATEIDHTKDSYSPTISRTSRYVYDFFSFFFSFFFTNVSSSTFYLLATLTRCGIQVRINAPELGLNYRSSHSAHGKCLLLLRLTLSYSDLFVATPNSLIFVTKESLILSCVEFNKISLSSKPEFVHFLSYFITQPAVPTKCLLVEVTKH